jgi:hypothetical protein
MISCTSFVEVFLTNIYDIIIYFFPFIDLLKIFIIKVVYFLSCNPPVIRITPIHPGG